MHVSFKNRQFLNKENNLNWYEEKEGSEKLWTWKFQLDRTFSARIQAYGIFFELDYVSMWKFRKYLSKSTYLQVL